MKKILFSLAAIVISSAALAQPSPRHSPPHGPGMDQRSHQGAPRGARHHIKKKVWVPTHREHGRMVRGHYVWR